MLRSRARCLARLARQAAVAERGELAGDGKGAWEACRRWMGRLPFDDHADSKTPTSWVAAGSRAPPTPPSGSKEGAEDKATLDMKTRIEGARIATESVMFPWERRQMDGQGTPLRTWEYVYWWALALAVALMLFNTSKSWTKKEEVDEEAEERKRESARAALAGKSFVDGDDPFEGLTPKEIQAVVEKMTGASEDDPYEGMTPEEINEYAEKHGLSKG